MPGQYGYPSGQPQTGAKPTRPREVVIAFWLIIAAAAMTVLQLLMDALNRDDEIAMLLRNPDFRRAMEQQGGQVSEAQLAEVLNGFYAVTLTVVGVIAVGLYLLVAFGVARRARTGPGSSAPCSPHCRCCGLFNIWFGTLAVLLGVAAIVLLFLPASNQFFQATKAHKYGIYGALSQYGSRLHHAG